jgi:3-oxoacyl-[acyl-carrier-protein] synthase II
VGNDVESTWQALIAGKSGIGRITTFTPDTFPVQIAGMVKDFDLTPYLPNHQAGRFLSRAAGFGFAASVQALSDAGVGRDTYEPQERGIAMGGSVGRPELKELSDILHTIHTTEGQQLYRQAPSSVLTRDQNVALATMGVYGDFEGPAIGISTACTASAHALGEAYRRIQEGDARLMVAGGYDALTSYLDVLGFGLLGALTTHYNDDPEHASRPFDAERSGFVLGEGAVVAILEIQG